MLFLLIPEISIFHSMRHDWMDLMITFPFSVNHKMYLGCFEDQPSRAMQPVVQNSPSMTTEKCIFACGSNNYSVAGTQVGRTNRCKNIKDQNHIPRDATSPRGYFANTMLWWKDPSKWSLYFRPDLFFSYICQTFLIITKVVFWNKNRYKFPLLVHSDPRRVP